MASQLPEFTVDGAIEPQRVPRRFSWCCASFVKQFRGHPDCWGDLKEQELSTSSDSIAGISFEDCCLLPRQGAAASSVPGPREGETEKFRAAFTLGFRPGSSSADRHLNLAHPRLKDLRSLKGCDSAIWNEVMLASKLRGGCLACSTPPGDLQRYFAAASPDVERGLCLVGQMVLGTAAFLDMPEQVLGQLEPEHREQRKFALQALEFVEKEMQAWLRREDPSAPTDTVQSQLDMLFFELFSATPSQFRYMMLHTSLSDDYPPVFDYTARSDALPLELSPRNWLSTSGRPLVFDIGMSGGMDSIFFLLHGFSVVAVEANPFGAEKAKRALQRHSAHLNLVNAAVVSDEDLQEIRREGKAPVVNFYIHKLRPDFSTLDGDRIPVEERAGIVPVPAVSCASLAAEYGRPYGIKIDAEGADHACLASLHSAGATPMYVSAELPHCVREGSRAAASFVLQLASMGYTSFKLCRQTLYNVRSVIGVDQETNESNIKETRQGLGLGASGLFGEAAVDWVAGTRWRSTSEIIAELSPGGPLWVAFSMMDWFDVHARLG